MILLDGKNLSAKIKDELKGNINSYKETPVLAVITIGKYYSTVPTSIWIS